MDVAAAPFVQAPLVLKAPITISEGYAIAGIFSRRMKDFREEEPGRFSMHWTCTAMCVADVLEVIRAITKPAWQIWDVEVVQFPGLDNAKFSWRCYTVSLSEMRARMAVAGPNLGTMYTSLRPFSALEGYAGTLLSQFMLQRTISAADASEISTPDEVHDFLDGTVRLCRREDVETADKR